MCLGMAPKHRFLGCQKAESMERREFLGGLAAISLAARGGNKIMQSTTKQSDVRGEMPYRVLGATGEKVSCIGLGGFHLGQSRLEEPDAIKLFQSAIDRGSIFGGPGDRTRKEAAPRWRSAKSYHDRSIVDDQVSIGRTARARL